MSKYLKQAELVPGSVYLDNNLNQYLYMGQLQVSDTRTTNTQGSQNNYLLPPMYLRLTKKSLKVIHQSETLSDCLITFIKQNNTFDFHTGLNITMSKQFLKKVETIYEFPQNVIQKATVQFTRDNETRIFRFTQIP